MKKLLSKFHQYPYRFDKTVKVSKIVDADTDDDDDDGIWTAMSRLQRLRRRRDYKTTKYNTGKQRQKIA